MNLLKKLGFVATLITLALTTGCAFTPQTVVIEPTVIAPTSVAGNGQRLSIYVVDERTNTDLGRRGTGAMKGAAITTEQNIAEVFSTAITENLNAMGYSAMPVTSATPAPESALIRVDIRSIEYETSMGFWTGGVHTRGSMKATATADARSYDKLYRVDEEKRVMVVPGADANSQMINATVSAIIQEMFNDTELFVFLGQ